MCARCHRNKKNLHAILRSGSELVSLPDRILLLIACRPRARVIRACAVGIARRGAQIGRLGAPCKAGGRWYSLLHGCRCHRAPQLRDIGDPVGRAALRLATGRGHLPFANRAGGKRAEIVLDAHGSCEQAGPVGWGERVTCDELIQVPAAWAARGEPTSRASGWAGCFGREGTPDICPGRPRGAGRGPGRRTRPAAPSPHHRNSARISWMVLEKGGFLI